MQINESTLNGFIADYKKHYGVVLSKDEATEVLKQMVFFVLAKHTRNKQFLQPRYSLIRTLNIRADVLRVS